MNTEIRKISVGSGYPDGSIHYQVGKRMKLQHSYYDILRININLKYKEEGETAYAIFIANEEGAMLWKTIVGMPCVVEYNIDFE